MDFLKKYKQNRFLQNILIVASGNTLAKVIGIISLPFITRLYTPEEFGLFKAFVAVFSIIGVLSTFRYSAAIPLAKRDRMADSLLHLCFLIAGLWGVLYAVAILFGGQYVLFIFDYQELEPYLWFVPLGVFFKGIYDSLNQWGVRQKYFKLVTRTEISKSTGGAAVKLGLGWLHYTPVGLFWGLLTEQVAGIISLILRLRKERKHLVTRVSKHKINYVARRFKRFPLFQSWSQFLLILGNQSPILILAILYSTEVVGVFSLAFSMITLPMSLIGQAVGKVYYAEIAEIGMNDLNKIYRLSIDVVKKMFLISVVAAIVLIAFGPWLFSLVFGAEWEIAGRYSQFLAIILLTQFLSNPLANLYNLLDKQNIQLIINIVRVLVVGGVFLIAKFYALTAIHTIAVFSVAMMIFYGGVSLLIFKVLKKQIQKNA